MLRKFFHFFGFHKWGKWEFYSEGKHIIYGEYAIQKRTCEICGKDQYAHRC